LKREVDWDFALYPETPLRQDLPGAFSTDSSHSPLVGEAADCRGSRRQIAAIDSDAVALAAMQGLNAKLEAKLAERDARLAAQSREIVPLRLAMEVLTARSTTDARTAPFCASVVRVKKRGIALGCTSAMLY
jgi:hypothetical protein